MGTGTFVNLIPSLPLQHSYLYTGYNFISVV